MAKHCDECRHWTKRSAFKNYDGGFPGMCAAPLPLWVRSKYGQKSTDRIMSSNQDARECAGFAQILEATE